MCYIITPNIFLLHNVYSQLHQPMSNIHNYNTNYIFFISPNIWIYNHKRFYYNSPKISHSCLFQHHCFPPLMNPNFFKKIRRIINAFITFPKYYILLSSSTSLFSTINKTLLKKKPQSNFSGYRRCVCSMV